MRKGISIQQSLFQKFMFNSILIIVSILLVFGIILVNLMKHHVSDMQIRELKQMTLAFEHIINDTRQVNQVVAEHWFNYDKSLEQSLQEVVEIIELDQTIVANYVVDSKGNFLYGTGENGNQVTLNDSQYKRLLEGVNVEKDSYLSPPYISSDDSSLVMNYGSVFDFNNQHYVIISVINYDRFINMVQPDKSWDGRYYIFDQAGKIVFGSESNFQEKSTGSELFIDPKLRKDAGSQIYTDPISGEYVFGTISQLQNSSFGIVFQYSLLKSFKPIGQALSFLVLIAIFASVVASLLSNRISEQFGEVLNSLTIAAKEIAAGDYTRLKINSPRYFEVESVTDAFTNMVHNINDREVELQVINGQIKSTNDELVRAFNIIRQKEVENKDQKMELISVLADLIELNDSYTGGHSKQVTYWTMILVQGLIQRGYEFKLEEIEVAAILHDIGKIGVPSHILKKPGKLDSNEYEVIKLHPIMGANALSKVPSLELVQKIVRHHHERFDGTGYPDKLQGEQIPLGARVVGIADAFHAMTSDRAYRKALSLRQATDELRNNSGTQFDPFLVNVFLEELSLIA